MIYCASTSVSRVPVRCSVGWLLLATTLLLSCTDARRFGTEAEAVGHFEQHQQDFDRAAALFTRLGVDTFEPATVVSSNMAREDPTVELSTLVRQLFISRIDVVPRRAMPGEQYVEFELSGHRFAPYGVIFVPEKHDLAMNSILSDVGAAPRVYRRVRVLSGRWFYFEYQ